MLEKVIEAYLVKKVQEIGGKAYKFVSPGNAGVPDRICLFPGEVVMFVEVKSPTGKTTPLQGAQQKKIAALGFSVMEVYSKQDVDELLINSILKGLPA